MNNMRIESEAKASNYGGDLNKYNVNQNQSSPNLYGGTSM